jgi:hypothetical protein
MSSKGWHQSSDYDYWDKPDRPRILICGDRNWIDRDAIESVIKPLSKDTIIIHGACRGADQIAGELAKKYGLEVIEYPAEWDKYGRAAGPIRNKQMLDDENPSLVLAFHRNLALSKGTLNMITQAEMRAIPVIYNPHTC